MSAPGWRDFLKLSGNSNATSHGLPSSLKTRVRNAAQSGLVALLTRLGKCPAIEKDKRKRPHSQKICMTTNLESQSQDAVQSPQLVEEFHPLDSRVVKLWRLTWLILFGIFLLILLGVAVSIGAALPAARIWLAIGWLALAAISLWFSFWFPPRYYHSWGWRIDARVLELHHGRLIQHTRLIPLARLQHVDLERGPFERMFGLASLVIHTAGTHAASTTIPGLEAEDAARSRDHLVEIGGDDAV